MVGDHGLDTGHGTRAARLESRVPSPSNGAPLADSVLLIDDDVDVLRSIGAYFERLSYEVTRELSGEAGLATFDRIRPEVVIRGLRLPGMDGMEVLEHLRQRDAAVILLTGESDVAT